MTDFKAFRKDNKLSQIKAAEYFGCNQSFISQIERGNRPIPEAFIEKAKGDISINATNLIKNISNISNIKEDYYSNKGMFFLPHKQIITHPTTDIKTTRIAISYLQP